MSWVKTNHVKRTLREGRPTAGGVALHVQRDQRRDHEPRRLRLAAHRREVETRAAVDEIDQIVRVPGVDVIFIGPGDLSTALGHMGHPGHPDVQAAFADVEAAARGARLALGNITRGWDQARELYGKGYQFLTLGADTALVAQGSQDLVAKLRQDVA